MDFFVCDYILIIEASLIGNHRWHTNDQWQFPKYILIFLYEKKICDNTYFFIQRILVLKQK